MFKLVSFLAVFVLLGLASGQPADAQSEYAKEQSCLEGVFQPIFDVCDTGVVDEDEPDGHSLTCIYTKLGLLGEGSELHVDKFVEHFKSHAVSEENTSAFLSAAQHCAGLATAKEGLERQVEEFDDCIALERKTVSKAIGCSQ